jgi:hypothetical protein
MQNPFREIVAHQAFWMSLLIGVFALNASCQNAAAYSCGTPSVDHCYGTNLWRQTGEYFGAYTDIRRGRMVCPATCGGFVDNEIWLIDNTTPACIANQYGQCWIEAGFVSVEGSQDPVFFWADNPPDQQFNLHLLGPADPAGMVDHFMIIKDSRVTPNSFLVFIYNDGLSTLYNGTSLSTGNTLKADRIDIGQELAGPKDAFADSADFTRNIWAVRALGPEYIFWYAAQTAMGTVTSNNPPSASWTIDPAAAAVPEGGQFTTRCCD